VKEGEKENEENEKIQILNRLLLFAYQSYFLSFKGKYNPMRLIFMFIPIVELICDGTNVSRGGEYTQIVLDFSKLVKWKSDYFYIILIRTHK